MEKKSVYFIEETQKIEGSYIEIDTLGIYDNQNQAEEAYENMIKEPKKSSGIVLNEYVIQAEDNFFKRLLNSWKKLPAEFYRKMTILTFRPLAEFQS